MIFCLFQDSWRKTRVESLAVITAVLYSSGSSTHRQEGRFPSLKFRCSFSFSHRTLSVSQSFAFPNWQVVLVVGFVLFWLRFEIAFSLLYIVEVIMYWCTPVCEVQCILVGRLYIIVWELFGYNWVECLHVGGCLSLIVRLNGVWFW